MLLDLHLSLCVFVFFFFCGMSVLPLHTVSVSQWLPIAESCNNCWCYSFSVARTFWLSRIVCNNAGRKGLNMTDIVIYIYGPEDR